MVLSEKVVSKKVTKTAENPQLLNLICGMVIII